MLRCALKSYSAWKFWSCAIILSEDITEFMHHLTWDNIVWFLSQNNVGDSNWLLIFITSNIVNWINICSSKYQTTWHIWSNSNLLILPWQVRKVITSWIKVYSYFPFLAGIKKTIWEAPNGWWWIEFWGF